MQGAEAAGTASATPTPASDPFAEALDAAGWVKEKDFDWGVVAETDTDIPEVVEVLPGMTTWVREVIINEQANHAASTTSLVNTLDQAIDTREYDEFVDSYRDEPKSGLEDAAFFGLIFEPGVSMFDDPRVAVSTSVDKSEEQDSAAVVNMTARAALPITDGKIRRWGFYIYSLTFNVQEGYQADGTWWTGWDVQTMSPGLATCNWMTSYSAGVSDDGMYSAEAVEFVKDFAGPNDVFDAYDFSEAMDKELPRGEEEVERLCGPLEE